MRGRPADSLTIDVQWQVRRGRAQAPAFQETLLRAARLIGFSSGQVSVAVVGAVRMARLHRQFSGVPGATDVLTFDYRERPVSRQVAGEIVVCLDVAAATATRLMRPGGWRSELILYAVHGLLHLAGEDDLDDAAFKRMHKREDRILQQLGMAQARIAVTSKRLRRPARPADGSPRSSTKRKARTRS